MERANQVDRDTQEDGGRGGGQRQPAAVTRTRTVYPEMGNSCVSVCLAFCSATKIRTNINYPPKLNYLFGFRLMEQMEQMQQTPYRKFSPLLDLGLWSRLHCIVVALCSWRREGKLALGSHVATLLLSLIRLCDAIMNPPFLGSGRWFASFISHYLMLLMFCCSLLLLLCLVGMKRVV